MALPRKISPFRSPKSFFSFPDMPEAEGFTFEKLTPANFESLYALFKDDGNAFTDVRFKKYESAKEYADFMQEWGAYMPKHGGQDWLFKQGMEYIGILHLYDLSLETFADNNKKAWIGFAVAPVWRNKGIIKKVLPIFVQYILDSYPNINYLYAMTLPNNQACVNTLFSAGFKEDHTELITKKYKAFILERYSICITDNT